MGFQDVNSFEMKVTSLRMVVVNGMSINAKNVSIFWLTWHCVRFFLGKKKASLSFNYNRNKAACQVFLLAKDFWAPARLTCSTSGAERKIAFAERVKLRCASFLNTIRVISKQCCNFPFTPSC